MNLFTLDAKLTLDTSDYEQKIQDVITQAKKDGATLNDNLYGSGTGVTSGGSQMTKTTGGAGDTAKGYLIAEAVQAGVNAVVDIGKEAVGVASDLREVQNVIDQTFGSNAEVINQWATGSARNYGLSELQAKQFAGYMGAMLQSSKFSAEESAEMAMNISQLAGDIASFYNLGIEEAYEKIRSGISGTSIEPLQGIGINLSVANLEEFSGKDLDQMTDKEKIQARYDYLLNATKIAQGDYSRTSDEFANASRTLENNLQSLGAKFGESLLPLITGATNAANSFFEVLYSQSAEESLSSIDETARNTAQSISSTAEQARAMVGVLEDYGNRSALTAEHQEQWDYVVNSLTRTIPELSGMLNMQTGEIEGGTSALYENIAAWEEAGRVAADTSALAAKEDYLSDISQNIIKEQAELAIAEKALSSAQTDIIAKAQEAATATGEAFDGTAESALYMLHRWADYYKSYGVKEIESTTSAYEEANAAVTTHKENLASLQTDYTTVEQSIETDSLALSETVGTMENDVTSSFENVGASMDTLVSDMDQSNTAYANAYNTGMGAASGLNDAYPAWEAAMSKYRFSPSGMSSSETYGPIPAEDTIGGSVGYAVASALNGAAVIMDGMRVGDLVTETVSRNIAQSAHSRRYST